MEKLEVEDFSGGVTDYYLNAPLNKSKTCDNLVIIQYPGIGKPFTRPGCQLYSSAAPQIPAGAQRISTSFIYKQKLHVQSSKKLYYFNAGAWTTVSGPTGNDAFDGASTSTYFTYSHWNYHTLLAHSGRSYPQKVVVNASNVPTIMEAGLPKLVSSGITITPAAGAKNWLYKFLYRSDYTAFGNVLFSDYGTPSDSKTAVGDTTVAITTLPVLANGATGNFLTATIVKEIYRTTDAGTVFYKVGEVANATTTFNDTVTDANLILNQLLYTEGGVLANDRPPKCKLVHVFGDVAYYANIEDSTGQILGFRVQQSVPGDIDSAPASLFLDLDDDIVAMSSTKSNLILFTSRYTYRVDGYYDELGRGIMTAERISDTAGCVSAQSPVQAMDGVFWFGLDAVYYTDGFKVIKLNGDYDKTHQTFTTNGGLNDTTRQERIQGKYDTKKNRIWWSVQTGTTDVNMSYVLDLNWGVRENATFTTCSGLDSWSPTAFEFEPDSGSLIRCDRRGYILKHSATDFADLKIDTGVAATSWVAQTIFYTLETVALNFGTSFLRKYVTGITVTCDSTTNLSLQIISNNDDGKHLGTLSPIRYRGNVTWGDPDVYWGDPGLVWDLQGLINEKRRMPAKSLRCSYKIIKLTNALVAIINSDLIGTATINSSLKTVTLTDIATYDWPTNSVDWYISFGGDNYTREYLITARTDDVLTYSDGINASSSGVMQNWVIRGYPKNEVLNLINYSLAYEVFGRTQEVYNNSDSGEVGT